MEPRTTFLQRYASEAGGDAAFGLRAQWRREVVARIFECADPPCGVDLPAKAWRALGDRGRKGDSLQCIIIMYHYYSELLVVTVRGLEMESGAFSRPEIHLPACGNAFQQCMLADIYGMARRSERSWVLRGAGSTGGARRKYVSLASSVATINSWPGPGARYGAPRVGMPVICWKRHM